MTVRGGKLYAIIADVCALANTNGGTLYIGTGSDPKKPPVGVPEPEQSITQLEKEIGQRISPPLPCSLDLHDQKGKKIMRVLIPRGDDPPYAVDDNKIYIRDEAETGLAVRDEIVGLVMRGAQQKQTQVSSVVEPVVEETAVAEKPPSAPDQDGDVTPRTGVEVLPAEERDGGRYYTMRDLRNGNMVKNVTRSSARRLWHYAISRYQEISTNLDESVTTWQGDLGVTRKYKQGKTTMYDLIQKTPAGYRYYFGVTSDGIHGPWKMITHEEES